MLVNDLKQTLSIGPAVACKHQRCFLKRREFSVEGADCAARFLKHQTGGCIVPWLKAHLEIELGLPRGHKAKLDGSAAETADIVALHVGVEDDVVAGLCEFLAISAHRRKQDRILESPAGNADGLSVKEGSASFLCSVEFVPPRTVDYPCGECAATHKRDAYGAVLVTPGIVCGAVDRVDDPDVAVVQIFKVFFFAEESASWQKIGQPPGEKMLDGDVGRGHQILARAFVVNLESAVVHELPGFHHYAGYLCYRYVFRFQIEKYC